jgi:hypothetical protein
MLKVLSAAAGAGLLLALLSAPTQAAERKSSGASTSQSVELSAQRRGYRYHRGGRHFRHYGYRYRPYRYGYRPYRYAYRPYYYYGSPYYYRPYYRPYYYTPFPFFFGFGW